MFTKAFWADALERAIKTFAQTAAGILTAAEGLGLFDIDWGDNLSVAGLAALISLLTSVASSGTRSHGTPQFVVDTYDYDV